MKSPLTPTQRIVASYMLAGWTRAQIARRMQIHHTCIKRHCLEIASRMVPLDRTLLESALLALGIEASTEPPPEPDGRARGPALRFTERIPAELVEEVRALLDAGWTRRQVGDKVGRTRKQIEYLITRHIGRNTPSREAIARQRAERGKTPRARRQEVCRPESRVESADDVVAAALDAAKRRECAWL